MSQDRPVELPPPIQQLNRERKAQAFEEMVAGPTRRRPKANWLGFSTGRIAGSKEAQGG